MRFEEAYSGWGERRLTQVQAAQLLGVCTRTFRRYIHRYEDEGLDGLLDQRMSQISHRRALRREVMGRMRKRYADFGPTLACEKLTEVHGYRLSAETLRQWMMPQAKSRRRARIHQRRRRRACLGELIQIDGSPHARLEDQGSACTLIVFIDDAAGRLLNLRLVPAETTRAYMEALGVYLAPYGRPVAMYSDQTPYTEPPSNADFEAI